MDNENTKDRAQLHVYPDADTAKKESQQRIEPMKKKATEPSPDWDPHQFDPEYFDECFLPPMDSSDMEVYSQISIHHPWFVGLLGVVKHIAEDIEYQKKARIVIDYDPQDCSTKIAILRTKETPTQGGD